MEFITDNKVFQRKMSEVESLIKREIQLPKQVFHRQFSKFVIIDFDEIFIDFFQRINAYVEASGEFQWTFAVTAPEPETYFYYHFKKYPVFEVTAKDSFKDYESLIWEDPGDSPADAIETNATVIIIYPNSLNWVIYADKDFEIGIIAFQNDKTMEKFISIYGEERIFTIEQTLCELLGANIPDDTCNEFLKNYS